MQVRGHASEILATAPESPAEDRIEAAILKTKGAFCTPRSLVRKLTSKKKPSCSKVAESMKELDSKTMGTFLSVSEKEKVFYKLLPTPENEETISKFMDFEDYKEHFKSNVDSKIITPNEYARLLNKSPDKESLISQYGYKAEL